MQRLVCLRFAALVTLALVAPACGNEEAAPTCNIDVWEQCPPPSDAARSKPWPELHASLSALADETEKATDPERWWAGLNIESPEFFFGPPQAEWTDVAQLKDKDLRYHVAINAEISVTLLMNAMTDLTLSRSAAAVDSAERSADRLIEAVDALRQVSSFRDPYGQIEPRGALFPYVLGVTVSLFVVPPAARHARAQEAVTFLEARLAEWEQMQRARLSGRPDGEIQAAIDEMGGPELRRLFAAWSAVEARSIRPLRE